MSTTVSRNKKNTLFLSEKFPKLVDFKTSFTPDKAEVSSSIENRIKDIGSLIVNTKATTLDMKFTINNEKINLQDYRDVIQAILERKKAELDFQKKYIIASLDENISDTTPA